MTKEYSVTIEEWNKLVDEKMSLESRLKEAERKRQCSEHHVKEQENTNDELSDENEALKARLSQAEAERDEWKKSWHDLAVSHSDKAREIALLMDVAGKMAGAIEKELDWVKTVANDSQCKYTRLGAKGSAIELESAIAEWDGIKDGGK